MLEKYVTFVRLECKRNNMAAMKKCRFGFQIDKGTVKNIKFGMKMDYKLL
jgi:hypothetical protein